LSVTFFVKDIGDILRRAASLQQSRGVGAMRAPPRDHGVIETIFGQARLATLMSPAGLVVLLVEQPKG
jgi:hypothetical protein